MDKPADSSKTPTENTAFLQDLDLLETLHMADSHTIYDKSIRNPEQFWGKIAENFRWCRKWDRVLDWNPKTYEARWFSGSLSNITTNMLDRHIDEGLSNNDHSSGFLWIKESSQMSITFTCVKIFFISPGFNERYRFFLSI